MLHLYEYEGCPFCRLVRETLTELDLDAIIYPCPRGGTRWRKQALKIGGRQQFPLLVDDNKPVVLYESAEIIAYLRTTYGSDRAAQRAGPGVGATIGSNAATLVRGFAGMLSKHATDAHRPEQLLELYSFESSPYSRRVREVLCELEIAYVLRNMGKSVNADMGPPWVRRTFFANTPVEGRNRQIMMADTGRMQVPYLVDPNTDNRMFESVEIETYLRHTYQG